MKKVFLTLLVAIVASTCAFAQQGASAAGINLGYGIGLNTGATDQFDLGVKYQYSVTDALRLEAAFTYGIGLKKNGYKNDIMTYGINAHYLFNLSDSFKLYPIAGIGGGTVKATLEYGGYSVSASTTGFMYNVGLGGEVALGENVALDLEVKYQGICISDGSVDRLPINLGISYKF